VDTSPDLLASEAIRATTLLHGKAVDKVVRHRPSELLLEFNDGTRLFIDIVGSALEVSITGGE
jgi:hypothetical protein